MMKRKIEKEKRVDAIIVRKWVTTFLNVIKENKTN